MKLLIVEDERELSDNIVSYLSSENYVCEQAFSYEEAGMKTGLYDYDCVVLDLMLPGGNGLDLLRELRRRRNPVGVIIVSAKDSLDDKIKGLELGADDYLSKPFHLAELSMRIYALIRRKEFAANNTLWSNGIEINLPGKSVRVDGRPVVLTRMEYELLLFFVSNAGRVVSKASIAEHLSGDMADMLDNHDFRVRTLTVRANRTLLESLVNNLVVNAVRHNRPGGEITVTVAAGSLTVSNTSDGKALDERLLFNRFYRPSEQVKGNGLGLAIVKAICQYHGWKVSYSYTGRHCFTVDFS